MSLSPKDMDFIEARHVAAREIALALGVPPSCRRRASTACSASPATTLDANMAVVPEARKQWAQRMFWRQTVLPLVNRVSTALSSWLSPAYGEGLQLKPDLDQLADSGDCGQVFRLIADSDSDRSRTAFR